MSAVFCKQCGVTDDQQAKCDDGCGVICRECDEFIDVEVSFFFSRSFRPLVVTDQLRHEVRLRAGIPRVLVAKELGDATRQQFPYQHQGCRMRQGSLSLTPRWFHRLPQNGWTPTSSLIRDFQIHSIQKSVFTK
jgi:hypothetical protein